MNLYCVKYETVRDGKRKKHQTLVDARNAEKAEKKLRERKRLQNYLVLNIRVLGHY